METYCIYLRKSRADADAEARGEGETLARHEHALSALATKRKYHISKVYREIVSGDTIAARPQMQQLLQDVESGIYAGVLVMEVERLARGDTIDQGIVAQAFKYSDTKIITPAKTYDPNNEYDEEYFEFSLFMSRREYKTIKRRMQAGRFAAAREGKYVGSIPPYGYDRKKLDHDSGFTLVPNPEEAKIVKMIFEWYVHGAIMEDGTKRRLGSTVIASRLHEMGCPTRNGERWSLNTVRSILINPVYTGMIRWGYRSQKKIMKNGTVTKSRPSTTPDNYVLVKGLHEPLISQEDYDAARKLAQKNRTIPKVNVDKTLQNPFAGILVCKKCGRFMVRQPTSVYKGKTRQETILCKTPGCDNVSSGFRLVEQRILDSLREWLHQYEVQWQEHHPTCEPDNSEQVAVIDTLIKEQAKAKQQLERAYDLLEQGIYDTNTFVERSATLKAKIADTQKRIEKLEHSMQEQSSRDQEIQELMPKVRHLLAVYDTLPDAAAKNQMLHQVIAKVEYYKEKGARWHGSIDGFDVVIYPRLPK